MKYYDYDWDLSEDRIILDKELNLDKLNWRGGDLFELINVDGHAMLKKVDPLRAFIEGRQVNYMERE